MMKIAAAAAAALANSTNAFLNLHGDLTDNTISNELVQTFQTFQNFRSIFFYQSF